MDVYKPFWKGKLGRQGGGVVLYAKEWLECMELCSEMGNEPVESLWVKHRGQINVDGIMVGVCYRMPDKVE